MYVPPRYREDDRAVLLDVARRHAFASLVSADPRGVPQTTWLPFLVEGDAASPRIYGHMARANEQWRSWDERTPLLAVFQGPHHYISPAWYATAPNVPTWNFVVVQVRGTPRLLDPDRDADEVDAMLGRLVDQFEERLVDPWALGSQPLAYRRALARGVAAFELRVEELRGMVKMSQGAVEHDRLGAVAALEAIGTDDAVAVAAAMRRRAPVGRAT